MIPILYEATEKAFTTNGLGRLSDVTVCTVTEERNGSYELEFEYPATGIHYDEIKEDRLVYVKPSEDSNKQIFRIYKVTEPDENGIATISAEHISYMLNKIPVMPFTAESCAAAISLIESYAAFENPFEFWTDKVVTGEFAFSEPRSIRSLLGGEDGSILDVYGKGEYLFDNFTVRLYLNRGQDNGVTIRYGKNLTELNGTIDMSNVYTGVVPYWKGRVNNADTIITIPEKVIWAPDTHADEFAYRYATVVNFSSDFKEAPTAFELGNRAREYLVQNEGWTIKKNISVSFVSLWQTEEYKDIAPLEKVHLCDVVTVVHPELGISVKMKVIKTEYDVLTEKYNSIELGDVKDDLNDAISELIGDKTKDFLKTDQLEQQTSFLEQEIDLATRKITGGLGGYVVFRYNANEQPEEILILDNPDIDQAVEVMRINRGGIGFSHTGYEGPFTSAWTIDGRFVADFISTGTLRGNLIKAGVISDAAGVNYWDMVTGEFRLASTITVGNKTVDTIATEKATAAKQEAISTANTNARNYTDTTLGAYAADVSRQFDNLQDQIDGQIETWYYDYVPTLNNAPASSWTTETERENHSGDIFYYKSKGYAYRFQKSDEIWGWVLIQDTDITTAIGKAQEAEDLADQKRRVFITTPQVPYDVGDLWVEGITGDIWRCKTAKDKDGYYETRDWELASKYTDDTKAQEAWDIAHTALASVSVEYYLSTSKTQLSGGVWSETAPEWREGYFMWSRTKSVGKDGTIGYSDPTCIAGATGATGPSGVGIESVSVSYAKSTTLTRPTIWQNNIPNVDEGEFLWTRTIIDYTDPTMEDSVTYTYAKQGVSGQDGTSVSITSIQYQAGTSSVNVPSGQWSDTVVSVNEGEFLWTKTLFSSGEIAYSVAKQGESGISIRSVTITYGVSNAPTDIPLSWTSTLPTVQDGYYLWTRTVTDYTDSSIQDTVTYSYAKQGEDGVDGAAGTSVSVSSIQYQAGTSGTVAPTGTWYDEPVLSAGQFLWTKTTFSDGNVAYGVSREGVDGRNGTNGTNGTDGVGILSVSTAYGVSDSPSEQPEDWSIVYPSTIQNGKFLWVRTITDYTDPNKPDTISYLYSRQGNDGEDGVAGTSVTVSSIEYQGSVSPTVAPTGTWSSSPVAVNPGQYLWTKTTFSDGTYAYGIARQGEDGEDGEDGQDGADGQDGVGIASVTVSYGTSNSASTVPSTWQSTLPTVPDGDYLWTRTVTDYTDPNVQDTVSYTYSRQGRDGENGQAGSSVTILSILYQAGSSPTVAPTGTWSSTPVEVTPGQYLWTKTSFSDGAYGYGVARQGEDGTDGVDGVDGTDGADGVGIASVTVSYGTSNSSSTMPSTWQSSLPTVSGGDYLWTRTVTDYTDPNVQDTVTYTYSRQGQDGENGQAGTSVSITSILYQAGSSPTVAPTGTWQSSPVVVSQGQFLWTKTTFSDESEAYSVARQGEDGNGINAVTVSYGQSASASTVPSTWSETPPSVPDGDYLWTRTVTDYTDPNVQDTVTYVYTRQGEDGENGQNGTSVTITRIDYNINTNWYSPPADSDSGWRAQIYEAASPYYLWTRITFSDGTKMYNKVKDGDSVQQIKEQYYVSTSNTTQTGGSWSYDSPTWEEGKYIWTRSVITLRTDATHTRVQYSDPVLANIFNDMYDHVETVSQTTAENYLQTNLDQERVFNALTNNGEIQGIFMQGGELFINSSYVTSGTLRLGGTNNTNGLLEVVDEYRFKNVQLDITGLNSYGRLLDGHSLTRPESWWYSDDTYDEVVYDDYGWPTNNIDSSKELTYVGWEYGNRYLKLRSLLNAGRLSFFINEKETLCIDVTQTSTIDQSTYLPDTQEPIISDSSRADYHPNKTYYLCHAYTSFLVLSDLMFTNSRATAGTSGSNPSEIMTVKSGTSGVVVAVDFTVRGRKNRVVETDDYSNRLLYSYETPSPMFGDVGEAVTDDDGLAYVSIDDIFAETVSSKIEYQVFLQKEGPGDIWVEEKNASYFVVKGTPDLRFSWELKGIQKDFEAERLESPNDTYGYSGPDLPSFDDLGDLESFVTEQEEILYDY